MKLSELKKLAREQDFNFNRVTRIHSSLYRLASGIPETTTPAYFDSITSILTLVTSDYDRLHFERVSNTQQWSLWAIRNFDVFRVTLK